MTLKNLRKTLLRTSRFKRGICFGHGRLVWGLNPGFLLSFPMWLKQPIVHTWNHIACVIKGHDDFEVQLYKLEGAKRPPMCSYCCVELPVDGVYISKEKSNGC